MTVQRYRRKPQPRREEDDIAAAKYDPPVTPEMSADLTEVAKLNDDLAEAREVSFPSGKRLLLVRYRQRFGGSQDKWAYVTVEPGCYLMFSDGNLHTADDEDLARWFEPAAAVSPVLRLT